MSLSRILNNPPPSPGPSTSANSLSRLLNDDPPSPPAPTTSTSRKQFNRTPSPRPHHRSPSLNGNNGNNGFAATPPSRTSRNDHWESYGPPRPKAAQRIDSHSSHTPSYGSLSNVVDGPSGSTMHLVVDGVTNSTGQKSRKRRKTSEHPLDLPKRVSRKFIFILFRNLSIRLGDTTCGQNYGRRSFNFFSTGGAFPAIPPLSGWS
jgi:hypothetical protein